jgi:hypothetical protein
MCLYILLHCKNKNSQIASCSSRCHIFHIKIYLYLYCIIWSTYWSTGTETCQNCSLLPYRYSCIYHEENAWFFLLPIKNPVKKMQGFSTIASNPLCFLGLFALDRQINKISFFFLGICVYIS